MGWTLFNKSWMFSSKAFMQVKTGNKTLKSYKRKNRKWLNLSPFIGFLYKVGNFLKVLFGINNNQLGLVKWNGLEHFYQVWYPLHSRSQSLQQQKRRGHKVRSFHQHFDLCFQVKNINLGGTHLQILHLHLMVDELLISPLLLRDGDVGQGGFKLHDLRHHCLRCLLRAAQKNPQLHQEVEVCREILWSTGEHHGVDEKLEILKSASARAFPRGWNLDLLFLDFLRWRKPRLWSIFQTRGFDTFFP